MTDTLDHQDLEPRFGIGPVEILHAFNRRKWIILASVVLVTAAVAGGTARQRKVYSASASIMIDPVLPKILDESTAFDDLSELARAERTFNNTQYEIIRGRGVLRRVAADLALVKDADFLRSNGIAMVEDSEAKGSDETDRLDAAADALARHLTVVPQSGSRIVRLEIEDFDPHRAASIANAIAQAYKSYTLDKRLSTTHDAQEWLDQQVAEFGTRLEKAEAALQAFRRDNKLVSVSLEDRQNVTSTKMARLNESLVGVRTDLIRIRARKRVLDSEMAKKDGMDVAVQEVTSNPVISSLKSTEGLLLSQKTELSLRYGPKHDQMRVVEEQLAENRAQIRAELLAVVATLENEIRALEDTERGISAALEEERSGAMALNELGLQYTQLARDYGTTKSTYEALLKRQTEADLSGRLTSNFVHLFETAEVNLVPVRPSLAKNAALGAVLGLFLGLLIAVAGLLLDNTVRTQADLEETLGLTFLGIVPSIASDSGASSPTQEDRDFYLLKNPKSSLAECLRSIRTNILFMGTDKPLHRILVTSPGPSEGKSTLAVNLAVAMAQAGNRVLVVDTDLRRPRLHKVFGVSAEQGLTTVLLRAAGLTDVIKATSVPGLDVLPCGPLPPTPAELLHSTHFAQLVEELSAAYDRVIFDSPPVNVVTDAVILAQLVQGTVLVSKVAKTTKDSLRRARRLLSGVNARILGGILNDIDLERDSYGYSSYYYYGGGRYGYGSEDARAKV
ncbi:MAG: polysaccharide biosynthesis tyrosine autokinase [Deltaproteobacteria bacterium]|nr:polysaccharide biosynthesis tyrosine autokinase [Deltaproteobacteria bacterium]